MTKIWRPNIVTIIIIIFILGIAIGGSLYPKKVVEVEKIIKEQAILNSTNKEINIVGLDSADNGIVAKMLVEVKPGSGLILVNINDLLADYRTQLSARNAARVASNITDISLSSLDIIYNIQANASSIEGPSAGAAMAIATIAALQNKTLNQSVFITGTIEENGTIGTVGGLGEKAKTAKDHGAVIFLIPQARYVVGYDEVKNCKHMENINYCEVSYLPKKIELSKLLKLDIEQVRNITEAVEYMII